MKLPKLWTDFVRRDADPLVQRFTAVYEKALWGCDETRSGWGSKKQSGHVQATLEYLNDIVPRHNILSIADIPCGDFNWQPLFLDEFNELRYTGYDIVPSLIDDNKRKYPGIKFRQLDITRDMPKTADLILCKDMLNHLTFDDIRRAISNMKRSGSKYLLASNDFSWAANEELINEGNNHRPVDICKAPLHFAPPFWRTHYMGLWRLTDLRAWPPQQAVQ